MLAVLHTTRLWCSASLRPSAHALKGASPHPLTFIAAREQGYAREIVEFWQCPDQPIKRELNRLEGDGVLIAKPYGRTIVYSNDAQCLEQAVMIYTNE